MSTTRKQNAPATAAGDRGEPWKLVQRKSAVGEIQADYLPTHRERFSAPASDLLALLEETALSIALRAEIYHEAHDIIRQVRFTSDANREAAAKIREAVRLTLLRDSTWKQARAALHEDPDLSKVIFAAFPRAKFKESETAAHAALATLIAEL